MPALAKVVRDEGPGGMFRGAMPTAIRQSPRAYAYHEISRMLVEGKWGSKSGEKAPWHAPVAGALCGTLSVILNNPIDVVKSRIQAESDASKQRGMLTTLGRTVKNEGPQALYKGITPRVAKIAAGQAIVFSLYEKITNAIGK